MVEAHVLGEEADGALSVRERPREILRGGLLFPDRGTIVRVDVNRRRGVASRGERLVR